MISNSISFKDCRIHFNSNPRIRAMVLNWTDMTRDDILSHEYRHFLRRLVIRAHREILAAPGLISQDHEEITLWTDDLGESRSSSDCVGGLEYYFKSIFSSDESL